MVKVGFPCHLFLSLVSLVQNLVNSLLLSVIAELYIVHLSKIKVIFQINLSALLVLDEKLLLKSK